MENQELRKKFLRDFYNQNPAKKHGFQLLKNRDVESMYQTKKDADNRHEVDESP